MTRRRPAPFTLEVGLHAVPTPEPSTVRRRAAMASEREVGSLTVSQLEVEPASHLLTRKSVAGDKLLDAGTLSPMGASARSATSMVTARRRKPRAPCLPPAKFLSALPTARAGCLALAFSPDGTTLAAACSDGYQSHTIRVFDTDKLESVCVLAHHESVVYTLDWSPDSRWLLSSSGDGTVCKWSIANRHSRTQAFLATTMRCTPPTYVYAARFHPLDHGYAVSASFDSHVRLWDTDSAAMLGVLGGTRSHDARVNVLVFGEDGDNMFTADGVGVVLVWKVSRTHPEDPDAYRVMYAIRDPALKGVSIVGLAPRPRVAQLLVLAQHSFMGLYDVRTHSCFRKFPAVRCTDARIGAVFSPDGRFVLAGGQDGRCRLWEADTGTPLEDVPGMHFSTAATAVAWHPTQHLTACCSYGTQSNVLLYFNSSRADRRR